MQHFQLYISLFVFMGLVAVFPSNAAQAKQCEGQVEAEVNGLVCDFCARALEKVFSREESVEAVNVNLDDGLVTVSLKPGQSLSEDVIRQHITDAGYDLRTIVGGC